MTRPKAKIEHKPIVFESKHALDKFVADAIVADRAMRARPLRERLQDAAPSTT